MNFNFYNKTIFLSITSQFNKQSCSYCIVKNTFPFVPRAFYSTSSSKPVEMILVKNGNFIESPISHDHVYSSEELLKTIPDGIYTSMRTIKGTSIVEFESHCKRLVESYFLKEKMSNPICLPLTIDQVKEKVVPSLKLVLNSLVQSYRDGNQSHELPESKVVVILSPLESEKLRKPNEIDKIDVWVQGSRLVPRGLKSTIVRVEGEKGRDSPQIKHNAWVIERTELMERLNVEGLNEIILKDSSGKIFEGLSSNFYAVLKDNTIVTAPPEKVLSGTIQKKIFELNQKHNITKILFECPNINQIDEWKSAFITSTTRGVLQIDEIRVSGNVEIQRKFEKDPFLQKLKSMVDQDILESATPI